jgi:hypothetical protein
VRFTVALHAGALCRRVDALRLLVCGHGMLGATLQMLQ